MKRISIAIVAALGLAVSLTALAQDKHEPKAKPAPTNPQFELFKKLAGTWTGTGMSESDKPSTFTYKLVAGGSTVMETIMPGTEHEMVTMYYMDGNDLVLTHYCMLGNQPHMKALPSKDPKVVTFVCDGKGSNMKSEKDTHMHSATFTFTDDNHITTVWTMMEDGKETDHAKFELTRKGA